MDRPLSDRILDITIGFTDPDRKQGVRNLARECEQLECENAHLFNLLKSVYYAIDGSSEGLPIPAEVWDEIEPLFIKANARNQGQTITRVFSLHKSTSPVAKRQPEERKEI